MGQDGGMPKVVDEVELELMLRLQLCELLRVQRLQLRLRPFRAHLHRQTANIQVDRNSTNTISTGWRNDNTFSILLFRFYVFYNFLISGGKRHR